jgi:ubiquinone/menaquinone biosynthesis C-methylase UbiE
MVPGYKKSISGTAVLVHVRARHLADRCACQSGKGSIKESTEAKYDQQWRSSDEIASAERRKSLSLVSDPLLSMVRPFDGKTVADLGVGTGALAFRALEVDRPASMIGLDFSSAGLCVARGISKTDKFRDRDFELLRADLESIPLAARSVDVILSQATVNLLPDKPRAFREMARITKPGGKIAISDAFRTRKPTGCESWEKCVAGAVTVAEFSALASSAGLMVMRQIDLTAQVRQLVVGKKWDWAEFLESNMDYRVFLLIRS